MSAIFNGWTQVQALGGRQPVIQAVGLSNVPPSVTLGWNAMSFSYAPIDSYNLYRSTVSGGQDFARPLATGISGLSYTDNTVAESTTYFYVIRPSVRGSVLSTKEVDRELKVRVPPVNMALVHRWIANWEMCTRLMKKTSDRSNNYRCPYTGPINNNGYYDVGHDQYWDTVELGCNYTPPNTNPALSCGDSTNGCLGLTSPVGVVTGGTGQVYYDRVSGHCYSWNSGTNWTVGNSASDIQLLGMASNQPGLPPFVRLNQSQSTLACKQLTVSGLGTKRLPRHSQQIVAGAWPTTFSDTQISSLEGGTSLPNTGYCNTNSADGLSYDFNITPTNLDTLPGSTGGIIKSVRTGSNATKNCISLHGLQDIVGNIWEWSTDQLFNCDSSSATCTQTGASPIDSENKDWYWNNGSLPMNFDGLIGPGGTSLPIEWAFSDTSSGATQFLPPLGLPLVENAPTFYDGISIGTGNRQIDPAQFHNNSIRITLSGPRGLFAGGGWTKTGSGRFSIILTNPPTNTANTFGARCMIDLATE